MTVENALKIEIERAKLLMEELTKIFPKLTKEFPSWADVGEAKRFNSLLLEIVEIFKYQK